MKKVFKTGFLILIMCFIELSLMQENKNYADDESVFYENFKIKNSEVLFFNDSYCLKNISVTMSPKTEFDDFNLSLFYMKIMWNSKYFMSSLKVESDSLSDSYCEAQNKHYYSRKPLNQSFHIFPDDVNEGVRFFPFKLDCKYIITPEFEGLCKPIQLKYLSPACLDLDICSCRNVFIPSPVIKADLEQNGITASWSFPQNIFNNVYKIVLTIYEEDGINIKKVAQKVITTQNFTLSEKIDRKVNFQINVTSNNYRIQGYFENKMGCHGNTTFVRFQNTKVVMQNMQEKLMVLSFSITLFLLFIFFTLIIFRRKKLQKIYKKIFRKNSVDLQRIEYFSENCDNNKFLLPPMEYNATYVEQPKDSYWFDYRDLNIERRIGSGNFGIVYFATSARSVNGFNVFAIKQIKEDSGSEGLADFLEEINIFKKIGNHPNVVKMFGYCSDPYPLSIIMEYVPFNLLKYLKNLRVKFENRKLEMSSAFKYSELSHSSSCNNSDENYISENEIESVPINKYKLIFDERNSIYYVLDNRELEMFALDIARGMAHLESKAIVHRDLAARNVLMDEFKNLKISDFGMSRMGIYVNKKTRNFPLRWMSPEALVNRTFSNKSDVWSFGVVLWEIATLGAFPYASLQNEEVMSFLKKGGHLDKPDNVTDELYQIMENCWEFKPDDRSTFNDIILKLEKSCQKSNGYVDFENLKANYVFPPMEEDIDKKKLSC